MFPMLGFSSASTHRFLVSWRMQKGVEPRPPSGPLRQGTTEQHKADAPLRGRGPSTASVVWEPKGSKSQFPKKQFLTLRASFGLLPGQARSFSFVTK